MKVLPKAASMVMHLAATMVALSAVKTEVMMAVSMGWKMVAVTDEMMVGKTVA